MKARTMYEAIPVGPETNPKESGWYGVYYDDEEQGMGWGNSYYWKQENKWTMGDGISGKQIEEFPLFWLLDHNQTREEIEREAGDYAVEKYIEWHRDDV